MPKKQVIFCSCVWPAFTDRRREVALFSRPLMSARTVGCYADAPLKRMIISGAHFICFLILSFFYHPRLPHLLYLLSLSLSPSSALPLMRSIPCCSSIKTTLIGVAEWNGMFDGFFSFPG